MKFSRVLHSFTSLKGLLLWCLLALGLCLAWLLGTNSGARFVAQQVMPMIPAKVENLRGNFISGVEFDSFEMSTEAAIVTAKHVELELTWRSLFRLTARVHDFTVGDLHIRLLNPPPKPDEPQEPFQLPRLPINLAVDQLRIHHFTLIQADGSPLGMDLNNLYFKNVLYGSSQMGLTLEQLQISNDLVQSNLSAQLKLEDLNQDKAQVLLELHGNSKGLSAQSPICFNPSYHAVANSPRQLIDCPLSVDVSLKGPLDSMRLSLKGSGQDLHLDGTGLFNLLAAIPLQQLDLDLQVPRHGALQAQLNTENLASGSQKLSGFVQTNQLNLNAIMPDSVVGMRVDLHIQANAEGLYQSLQNSLSINPGSRWNSRPLRGSAQIEADLSGLYVTATEAEKHARTLPSLALEKLQLSRADINLSVGDNQIQTQGQLAAADAALMLQLDLPKLAQIWPNIGVSAQLDGNINGNIAQHHYQLRGSYQFAESTELGQAPISWRLAGQGKAQDFARGLRYQGELSELSLDHAGFSLTEKQATSIQFTQAPLLSWQLGASDFSLRLPGGKQALIHHLGSSVQGGRIHSSGSIKQLAVSTQLMQLLRLPLDKPQAQKRFEDVLYDADWELNLDPLMQLQLALNRQGKRFLPIEPDLPLDLQRITLKLLQHDVHKFNLKLDGTGDKSHLEGDLHLDQGQLGVLSHGHLDVNFSDGSSLNLLAKQEQRDDQLHRVDVSLRTDKLNLYALSLGAVPDSVLSTQAQWDFTVNATQQLQQSHWNIRVAPQSLWRKQSLQAQISGRLDLSSAWLQSPEQNVSQFGNYDGIELHDIDAEILLGDNHILLKGGVGQADQHLSLDSSLGALEQLWPTLKGKLNAHASLSGSFYDNELSARAEYMPNPQRASQVLHLNLQTHAQSESKRLDQWELTLDQLQAYYAGFNLDQKSLLEAKYLLDPSTGDVIWQAGAVDLNLTLPNGRVASIVHQGSHGQGNTIYSQGRFSDLSLNEALYHRLQQAIESLSGAVDLPEWNSKTSQAARDMVIRGEWDLAYDKTLKGDVLLERTLGSGIWPFNTPVPIDFDTLRLTAVPNSHGDSFDLAIQGQGEKSTIDTNLLLDLADPYFIQSGKIDFTLPDGTGLQGNVLTTPNPEDSQLKTLELDLVAKNLALDKLTYGTLPPSMINGKLNAQAIVAQDQGFLTIALKSQFDPKSSWNKQALSGDIDIALSRLPNATPPDPITGFDPHVFAIQKGNIDVSLGKARVKTQGAFGHSGEQLDVDIYLPSFAALYPGLSGGAKLNGYLKGAIDSHEINLVADYAPAGSLGAKKKENLHALLNVMGSWGVHADNREGWAGAITRLEGDFMGFGLKQDQIAGVYFVPAGVGGKPEWILGGNTLTATLPGGQQVKIKQLGSTGKDGLWTSKGAIDRFVVSPNVINDVNQMIGRIKANDNRKGGIIVRNVSSKKADDLIFNVDWNLGYNGILLGDINLKRLSGDYLVPTDNPFALGIRQLEAQLTFSKVNDQSSVLKGNLDFITQDKGNLKADFSSVFNGMQPNLRGGTSLRAQGQLKDIAWASSFTNDLLSLGGALDFTVQLQSRPNGQWDSSGTFNGSNLKIVEVENGIRLLNGTLKGSLHNNTVQIDSLRFPSVIRITPSEWRTRQWIAENPPAQNGSLEVKGHWDLLSSKGKILTQVDHYPIIQRADRFVMISGLMDVDAVLPKIVIGGDVTTNAGWASIDLLDTVPAVDGDVVVLKPGQTSYVAPPQSPMDLLMDLRFDLGSRFYLVGMGLNSGLVGNIHLMQEQNRLTAEGEFRTRGGAIEAYGQRLQIRRGNITFTGNIANPSLNIEAVRTGPEVEAGVRVIGTAKKPKITLVSYPDVSEVEKLSWLIMGRGPDSSGADLALLFSVGSSILGGEEPFYKKVGIDDIGISSGGIGDTDNILPDRTVADSTAYKDYEQGNQFFYASRKFGDSWRVNLEQAFTGTGTVVRGSYILFKYATVDLKIGMVNGIEFVYKRFFRD